MSSVTERFLRYVSFDTMSDEASPTCPSTAKQKLLGAALVEEMKGRARVRGQEEAVDWELESGFSASCPWSSPAALSMIKAGGWSAGPSSVDIL